MEIILKLVIFTIGILIGGIIAIVILDKTIKAQRALLKVQRTLIKKQDNAIRRKQNEIDRIGRELAREKRKKK